MENEAANAISRNAGDRALEQQFVRVAIRENNVADVVPIDGPAKRLLDPLARGHDVDDVANALAPGQQLSRDRLAVKYF